MGVYFVLCLIWKTGAGLCGGRSHIHPMKLQFNILTAQAPDDEEAEPEQKRLNFSSSQENGIIQYVLFIDVLFLSV